MRSYEPWPQKTSHESSLVFPYQLAWPTLSVLLFFFFLIIFFSFFYQLALSLWTMSIYFLPKASNYLYLWLIHSLVFSTMAHFYGFVQPVIPLLTSGFSVWFYFRFWRIRIYLMEFLPNWMEDFDKDCVIGYGYLAKYLSLMPNFSPGFCCRC